MPGGPWGADRALRASGTGVAPRSAGSSHASERTNSGVQGLHMSHILAPGFACVQAAPATKSPASAPGLCVKLSEANEHVRFGSTQCVRLSGPARSDGAGPPATRLPAPGSRASSSRPSGLRASVLVCWRGAAPAPTSALWCSHRLVSGSSGIVHSSRRPGRSLLNRHHARP